MPEKTTSPWALPYPTAIGEVKLGATDFEELAVKLNTIFNEKLLVYKSYTAPATLKGGELAVQTKTGETFTLPTATVNTVLAVFCGGTVNNTCKVTTSGGAKIFGDYINEATTITLTGWQHVLLQADGTNWLILAGEPKREQKYNALAPLNSAEEVEPSAIRPTFVVLYMLTAANNQVFSFIVPPAIKFKATIGGGNSEFVTIVVGGVEIGVVKMGAAVTALKTSYLGL